MNMRHYEAIATCTDANTQYTLTIPDGAVNLTIKARTLAGTKYDFRLSGTTGRVAGSTEPYQLIEAGDYYFENVHVAGGDLTLYVASAQAGLVIQAVGFTTKSA